MIDLIVSLSPVLLGFFTKLVAIRSKAASDTLKLSILANKTEGENLMQAREQSNKESPYAAFTRRVVVFSLLGMVAFYLFAGAFLDVPTVVPVIHEGISFLGFQLTNNEIEYITVKGLLKHPEIFEGFTLMLKFWFGSQFAK